jgi:hypothetical protein
MINAHTLKRHYDINTNLIRRALADLTGDDLLVEAPYHVNSVNWVFFFYFHDSYHTGELATVRQLTGKPVKVV